MKYVHVPFCRSFCTYCDFYSETACRGKDIEGYLQSLEKEAAQRPAQGIPTLYIGGGTPSVLSPIDLERIVNAVGGAPEGEFTMEVNPEDIVQKGLPYAAALKSLGVNRISMGVQSLDDGILRWMNRRHDSARALEAFTILREAGFDNISVDVIFGISHLEDAVLEDTLARILSWEPEHISAYQLSIEEGSALASLVAKGRYREASDEHCRRQYALICSALSGYDHYEISNWAKKGFRAVHNAAYWTREPYVGLGPGAHSLIKEGGTERRTWNSCTPAGWTSDGETLFPEQILRERIMLGLRTSDGIPSSLCPPDALERLLAQGSLIRIGDTVRIPEDKFFVSDSVILDLI